MSLRFRLEAREIPSPADLGGLLRDAVVVPTLPARWTGRHEHELWLPGVSTRRIQLTIDDAIELETRWLASTEDLIFVRDVLSGLLRGSEGVATVQGASLADFDHHAIKRAVDRDLERLTDPAVAGRPIKGPRTAVETSEGFFRALAGAPAEAVASVLRAVQWPGDRFAWRVGQPDEPSLPTARPLLDHPDAPRWVAWNPFERTLLPPTELVVVPRSTELYVPIARLDEVVPGVRRLDAAHREVAPVPEHLWAGIRERLLASARTREELMAEASPTANGPAAEPSADEPQAARAPLPLWVWALVLLGLAALLLST